MNVTEAGKPEYTPEEIVRYIGREGETGLRSPCSDHIRSFPGREGVYDTVTGAGCTDDSPRT